MKPLSQIATTLDQAAMDASATVQVSHEQNITLDDAYAIQKQSIKLRFDRGESLTGLKLGFTSKAKMEQMGVHDIIWGRLTSTMEIKPEGSLERSKFIHPRVEPEIAFRLSKKIDRVLELNEVGDYIDGVAAALEVIDSRYQNFKFSLEDVVADNCSSAAYIIGDWLDPKTAVQDLSIILTINGKDAQTGNSNAILGNPLESLVEISRMLAKYGETVEAGSTILAGAATSAVHIHEGDQIEGQFAGLGSVKFNVVA